MNQPPAIDAIGSPQTAFQQVGFIVLRRTLPGLPGALLVIGMEGNVPAVAVTFIQRQPSVIHPLLIEIDVPTIGPGGPNDLRHGLREGRNSCSLLRSASSARFRSVISVMNE